MKLLALLLFAFPAWGVDYYVSPGGGTAWPNCTSVGSPCTLAAANANLTAGDTAYLLAGNYSTNIRPANSGTSDSNRIIYRAHGDGDVSINNFGSGADGPTDGAIAIGQRNYVTVSGRAIGDPITAQRIRAVPSSDITILGNVCGSEGAIVENIYANCPSSTENCARGFGFCVNFWPGVFETRYNILRDSYISGVSTAQSSSPPAHDYTEDLVTLSHESHHNVIERNTLALVNHSTVYADSPISHTNVVRGNNLSNVEHTGLSVWSAGVDLAGDSRFLVEGNFLVGSGQTTTPNGGPGNAFQCGSGEMIIRHNVIAEGGALDGASQNQAISGLGCATGTTFGAAYVGTDLRVYHNTIVKNSGTAISVLNFGDGTEDLGRNTFLNNIIYGSVAQQGPRLIDYWPGFDTGLDKYQNNIFGNVGAASSQSIINVGAADVSLATAISNYTNPSNPQFIQWQGFDNVFDATPGFVDYANDDYNLLQSSNAVDAGSPLAVTTSGATGTALVLDDSRWFFGECGEFPAWMGVECDYIAVGATLAAADIVQIASANDNTNTITLASSIAWDNNDFVWLYRDSSGNDVISGSAPDIGAFEYQQAQSAPATPIGLNLVIVP